LGEQVGRLFAHAGRDRTKLILFDDFAGNPKQVYEDVLDFLDLPSDGRTSFAISNSAQAHRWPRFSQLLMRPPFPLNLLKGMAKQVLRRDGTALYRHLSTKSPRPPLRTEFRQELIQFFREDTLLLQDLIDRDLSHWFEPADLERAA
jgi:hypothetical protein